MIQVLESGKQKHEARITCTNEDCEAKLLVTRDELYDICRFAKYGKVTCPECQTHNDIFFNQFSAS